MITSENVVLEEQFKSIYITWKTKIPFFLTYLTFCILNHSTNLGHDGEYIFEYIFSMVNHLVMKLGQLLDIDMGDIHDCIELITSVILNVHWYLWWRQRF